MLRIDLFKEILKSPGKGFIIIHQRPDGDAMGAGLALYTLFKNYKKEVTLLSPTPYEKNLSWLPYAAEIEVWKESEAEKIKNQLQKADYIICVDFSTIKQAGNLASSLIESKATKYIIDHHTAPEDWGTQIAWDIKASSATLLVYRLFKKIFNSDQWKDLALITHLYTGLLTDTGLFQHENTTPEAHQMAADLIKKGIIPKTVYEKLYQTENLRKLKFLGNCLQYNLHVFSDLHFAYITVKQKDIQRFALQAGDTRGLSYHIMSIANIKVGVVLMDHRDHIRLSFRSKGDIPINTFAKKHFHGGGHKNAAGGISKKDMGSTLHELIKRLKEELLPLMKNKN